MFFAFGLCFEVPVAFVILATVGIVDLDKLRRGRRFAIVGAFVIAALITPPDITSMMMLGIRCVCFTNLACWRCAGC